MCTVMVRIPVHSELGQSVAFLQHIMSLAVVQAVTTIPGYKVILIKIHYFICG